MVDVVAYYEELDPDWPFRHSSLDSDVVAGQTLL